MKRLPRLREQCSRHAGVPSSSCLLKETHKSQKYLHRWVLQDDLGNLMLNDVDPFGWTCSHRWSFAINVSGSNKGGDAMARIHHSGGQGLEWNPFPNWCSGCRAGCTVLVGFCVALVPALLLQQRHERNKMGEACRVAISDFPSQSRWLWKSWCDDIPRIAITGSLYLRSNCPKAWWANSFPLRTSKGCIQDIPKMKYDLQWLRLGYYICIVNIKYAFSKTYFFLGQGHSPTVLLLVIQAPGQPSLPAAGAVYFTQKDQPSKEA